jgi:hypothetical protein
MIVTAATRSSFRQVAQCPKFADRIPPFNIAPSQTNPVVAADDSGRPRVAGIYELASEARPEPYAMLTTVPDCGFESRPSRHIINAL